jgi:hypothetical protein
MDLFLKRTISVISFLAVIFLTVGIYKCTSPSSLESGTNDNITVSGYYSIIKPYKGYRVKIGHVDTIQWTSNQGSSDYVSLYLCNDTSVIQTISPMTLNTGSVTWTPYQMGSMSKCRIKIAKYDDADKHDFSGTFSIYSDYSGAIVVTSPPKDTTWSVGQTYSIRWSTTGNVGSYMTIQLYKDTSLISNISSQTSNDGVQSWSCNAASSGTDYRIKVSSY